jgi:hypothetical protein
MVSYFRQIRRVTVKYKVKCQALIRVYCIVLTFCQNLFFFMSFWISLYFVIFFTCLFCLIFVRLLFFSFLPLCECSKSLLAHLFGFCLLFLEVLVLSRQDRSFYKSYLFIVVVGLLTSSKLVFSTSSFFWVIILFDWEVTWKRMK